MKYMTVYVALPPPPPILHTGIFAAYIDDSIMLYHGWTLGEVSHCLPTWVTDNASGDRLLEVEGAPQGYHPLPWTYLRTLTKGESWQVVLEKKSYIIIYILQL